MQPVLQMHSRALGHSSGKDDSKFLEAIGKNLPCGPCKTNFAKYRQENPPDFSTVDKYFEWTWSLHNDVNKTLEKPEITLEEARAIYRPAPPT